MQSLYIDIETVPYGARVGATVAELADEHREYMESFGLFRADKPRSATVEETYRRLALDPLHGRILVIGCAVDDEDTETWWVDPHDPAPGLTVWWGWMCERFPTRAPRWVGWHVAGFDIPFLRYRLLACGGPLRRAALALPWGEAPWRMTGEVVDVMRLMWGPRTGARGGLEAHARCLLGSEGKPIESATVLDRYLTGEPAEHELIRELCASDVEMTRDLYRLLMWDGRV